jgi:hypothetical protein
MLALILCLFFAGDSFGQIPELNAPCRNGQCDLQRPLQSIAVPILTAPAKIYRATPLPSFPSKTPTARRDCPGGVCPVPSQTIYRRQWIYRR